MKFSKVHSVIIFITFLVSQSFFGQIALENEDWYVKKKNSDKKMIKKSANNKFFKVLRSRGLKDSKLVTSEKEKVGKIKSEKITINELEKELSNRRLRYRKIRSNKCFKAMELEECGAD